MSDQVEQMTTKANNIFKATDEALRLDWNRKDNLQFPKLLNFVLARLQGSADAANVDQYVRDFVRESPSYKVSRGAKGGIMLTEVYEARQTKKDEVKALIDEKLAAKATPVQAPVVVVGPVDAADEESNV